MDMASGKVYFWDSDTNEVAWQPPANAKPRSKHDNAATFAAHVSANDVAVTAMDTDPAAAAAAAPGSTPIASSDTAQALDNGAQGAAGNDKQAARSTDITLAQTDQLSSEEEEDGQLEAGTGPVAREAPAQAVLALPEAQVGMVGQQVVDLLRQSNHRLCRNIPQLVRLAVEAEIRQRDWQMFSSKQQRAVDQSQPEAAVTWADIQDHMQWRWQSIQAALPAAVAEAQQLHSCMDAELELGEMPPLPSDDAAASSDGPSASHATLNQAPAPAVNGMPADASGSIVPPTAPPLPEDHPSPAATGADEDADMDLDMDVDVEAGTRANRPGSADSTGQSAATAPGAALPDWAGYYMAHGYTYPYYGEASSGCLCRCCHVYLHAVLP